MVFRRLLFILLALLMIFPLVALGSGSESEYEEAIGIGEIIGYYDGLYYETVPKLSEVIDKYEMYFSNKDSLHRNYFVDSYYEGFEKSYKSDIDSGELENIETIEYADILGLILGEIHGNKDYHNNEKYNSRNALPEDNAIISNYNLNNLNSQDRISFLRAFKQAFETGYREGYFRANFSPIKTSYEDGLLHGEYFGSILGQMNGIKAYFGNLGKNFKRNIPNDEMIESTYLLDKDKQEYRDAFIEGFKKAYEESYNNSYSSIKVEENIKLYKLGYSSGREAGIIQGKSYATIDFYKGLENNWRRHYPLYSDLIIGYNLFLQDISYRDSFKIGFIEGLYMGYTDEYERLYSQTYINNTITKEIPISGGVINISDMSFSVKVEEGTFYNPVVIKVENLSSDIYNSEDLVKASNIYRVNISNSLNLSNDKKYIELNFEYYGGDNGGIYKLVEDKWYYIPSKVEEGFIKAYVKPESIKDNKNTYGVFIDREYNLLLDIRNHWAKEEVITYQKRNIIKGYSDRNFRPDSEITKGEFFIILSKIYHILGSASEEWSHTGEYEIGHALVNDYIEALEDKEINAPVTYREVETIMRRLLNSENFHWHSIAEKILYEKQYKSKSFYSKDNYMTRAEAVYMLYIINERRF